MIHYNINKVLGACALSLCLFSCTDGNDWGTDSSTDRLFGVPDNLSVDAEDVSAVVTFKTVPQAQGYTIELSNDTLYDDIAEGASSSSKIYKIKENITGASCEATLLGLNGETNYYLRIKSVSDLKPNSKWVYYKTGSGRGYFKTKAEQIFYPVTSSDIEDGRLHLSWKAGSDVTKIAVSANDEEVQCITLTADQRANGECDILGLAPTTTFTIEIYNDDVRRGTLTVTTPAAMPAADYKYYLAADATVISQDLLDEISEAAKSVATDPTNYSATIGIPAGITIDIAGINSEGAATSVQIPDGMSITFFGLAGGEAPLLKVSKSVDIRGTHAYVRFNNVAITDGGCQYFINQAEACTLGELSFTDVKLTNMSRSWVRLQGSSTKAINELIIDNCIADTQGSGGYALFYFNNKAYNVGTMTIKNSTFCNLVHSFTDCRNAVVGKIDISDCTFYNIIGGGRYFIDAQNVNVPISLNNTIFALTNTETSRGVRNGVVEAVNSYMTNDFKLSSNAFTVDQEFDGSANDLFSDPANGDFTLKVSLKTGDPRWWKNDD